MARLVAPALQQMFDDVAQSYDQVDRLLATSEDRLTRRVESISGWSPAQHLYHVAVSNSIMLAAVDRIAHEAKPASPGGSVKLVFRYVLLTRHIPRGRAKAPERSVPPDNPGRLDAAEALTKSRMALARVKGELPRVAESTWRVDHFAFGRLDARQWLRLISIHADHHFKIIDEILAA